MNLTQKSIDRVTAIFRQSFPAWEKMIEISFLSDEAKAAYWRLLSQRRKVLSL
jgi:hypothetical protein